MRRTTTTGRARFAWSTAFACRRSSSPPTTIPSSRSDRSATRPSWATRRCGSWSHVTAATAASSPGAGRQPRRWLLGGAGGGGLRGRTRGVVTASSCESDPGRRTTEHTESTEAPTVMASTGRAGRGPGALSEAWRARARPDTLAGSCALCRRSGVAAPASPGRAQSKPGHARHGTRDPVLLFSVVEMGPATSVRVGTRWRGRTMRRRRRSGAGTNPPC